MILFLQYSLFFIAFFSAFFVLHSIARNDFVMLRRGVDLSTIFDGAFVASIIGLLFSRLFYVVDTFSFDLLNPVLFFHLFRVPGLSMFGFFAGAILTISIMFRGKNAFRRAFDIYLLGFFPLFVYFLVLFLFFSSSLITVSLHVVHIIASLILFGIFFHAHKNFSLQDGSVGLLLLEYVLLSVFFYQFLVQNMLFYSFSITQYLTFFAVVIGIVLLLVNQKKIKVKIIRR